MGRSYAHTLQQFGPLAQGLEQRTHNPSVVGSNPTGPTQLRLLHSILGPVSLRPPPRRCTHAHLAAALASKSYRAHSAAPIAASSRLPAALRTDRRLTILPADEASW